MLFDRENAKEKCAASGITKHIRKNPRLKKAWETGVLILIYSFLYLSALAISVVMCAQNSDLYLFVQEKCLVFEGEQAEDKRAVVRMNREIIDYLSGKTEQLDGASDRANAHMRDVRRIFRAVSGSAVLLLALSGCLLYAERSAKPAGMPLICFAPILLSFTLFIIFAFSDFTRLFTRFHEILFTNDLWILDPEEDWLIRCLPEQFFLKMAQIALGCSLILYGLMAAAAVSFINKFGRRDIV